MMRYLLHTDTCSFVLRRNQAVLARLAGIHADDIGVSTVTLAEGWTGSRKSRNPERWLAAWRHLLSPWKILDFDSLSADAYSKTRAHLEKRGAMIGGNDCLIAATALAHGLTVVTHNTEEFERVPALRVEDWSVE